MTVLALVNESGLILLRLLLTFPFGRRFWFDFTNLVTSFYSPADVLLKLWKGRWWMSGEPDTDIRRTLRFNKLTFSTHQMDSPHFRSNHCTPSSSFSLWIPFILQSSTVQWCRSPILWRDKTGFVLWLSCLSLQYKCTKLCLTESDAMCCITRFLQVYTHVHTLDVMAEGDV